MPATERVYTTSPSEPLSQTVVYAVADTRGVEPTALDETLYDCIDPDALDTLFESTDRVHDGRLTFTMCDCRVEVDGSTGTVVVTDCRDEPITAEITA
ncbi:HalOD1 output domain-containing protein [Haloarcula litorea]|uniref:HalOD1 output domain-containing protein n=1 Tax=Haloarcula litorea TaxID=3032579 RepID=UPI0023E8F289|nr:HalOD1 output domain-containing protein [Halomicroarcula sp. GDY20]